MPRHELAFIVAEGGVERVGSAFIYLQPIVGVTPGHQPRLDPVNDTEGEWLIQMGTGDSNDAGSSKALIWMCMYLATSSHTNPKVKSLDDALDWSRRR